MPACGPGTQTRIQGAVEREQRNGALTLAVGDEASAVLPGGGRRIGKFAGAQGG